MGGESKNKGHFLGHVAGYLEDLEISGKLGQTQIFLVTTLVQARIMRRSGWYVNGDPMIKGLKFI
jgi:hypothetical protein